MFNYLKPIFFAVIFVAAAFICNGCRVTTTAVYREDTVVVYRHGHYRHACGHGCHHYRPVVYSHGHHYHICNHGCPRYRVHVEIR